MQQQGKKDLFVAYCNWSAGAKQDNRGLIKPIRKCSLQLQLQFLGDENKNLLCFLKLLSNTNIKHFFKKTVTISSRHNGSGKTDFSLSLQKCFLIRYPPRPPV